MRIHIKWIGAVILGILLCLWIMSIFLEDSPFINSINAQENVAYLNKELTFSDFNRNEKEFSIPVKSTLNDIWMETYANLTVIPGRTYICRIKLWNKGVNAVDHIKIKFLAPNLEEVALDYPGAKLYTEYVKEINRDNAIVQAPNISTSDLPDFIGKLDSIVWRISGFKAQDSTEIEFELRADRSIASNTILHNKFLIIIVEDNQESLILSDTKTTGILLLPDIQISKSINKDTVAIGEIVNFTINIKNNGKKDAENVFIIDQLPQELEFIGFMEPSDADATYFTNQWPTWEIYILPKWEIDSPAPVIKEVGFSARVREDIEIEDLVHRITNEAIFKRGEVDSGLAEATLYISSDPDLISEITNINVPTEWGYDDSIKIDCLVKNIGGTDVTDNFIAKLYYVDEERAPLEEIIIWEGTVYASINTLRAFGRNSLIIPTKSVKFDKGGNYKFCVAVDLDNVIRERNENNNEACETSEIRIPGRSYLNRNVIRLDQLPDGTAPPGTEIISLNAQIPIDGQVEIKIYDVAGDLVKNLFDEFRAEGYYDRLTSWDCRDEAGNIVGSGVYVFTVNARKYSKTLKVIVVR